MWSFVEKYLNRQQCLDNRSKAGRNSVPTLANKHYCRHATSAARQKGRDDRTDKVQTMDGPLSRYHEEPRIQKHILLPSFELFFHDCPNALWTLDKLTGAHIRQHTHAF